MKHVEPGKAGLLLMLASACATTPPPHQRFAASTAAVKAADESGAGDVPQAALYLQSAREELQKGHVLMQSGDNRPATAMFARSQADAELALAVTRESKTREAAREAITRVENLRNGTAVGGGPVNHPDSTKKPTEDAPTPSGEPNPSTR
jgi:hypothetical protein